MERSLGHLSSSRSGIMETSGAPRQLSQVPLLPRGILQVPSYLGTLEYCISGMLLLRDAYTSTGAWMLSYTY